MDRAQAIVFLQEAFVHLPTHVISQALDKSAGDVEVAMENLLTDSFADVSLDFAEAASDKAAPSDLARAQEEEDARLARELSEQFMREDAESWDGSLVDEDEAFAKRLQQTWHAPAPKASVGLNAGPDFSNGLDEDLLNGVLSSNFSVQDILQSGLISPDNLQSVLAQMKDSILPLLRDEIRDMHLPQFEETIEIPKLGPVAFGITDTLEVATFDLPSEQVDISVDGNLIHLVIRGLSASLNKFPWRFAQENFPKLKDKGKATAEIDGTSIDVRMGIALQPSGPCVNVESCEVKITNLDVKISGNNKKIVYNIVVGAVIRLLKGYIEKMLAGLIAKGITEHGKQLLGGAVL